MGGIQPVGAGTGTEPRDMQEPPAPFGPSRFPAIAFRETGAGAVAWREGGVVFVQRFDENLRWMEQPRRLNSEAALADLGPKLALSGDHLCVTWSSRGKLYVEAGGGEFPVGDGLVQKVLWDPLRPGWWLLSLAGERLTLQHLRPDGLPEGGLWQPLDLPLASVDFAVYRELLLIVTEEKEGLDPHYLHGPIRLWAMGRDGQPVIDPIAFPDAQGVKGSAPRIAVSGLSALVAWTDQRDGNPDVYCRMLRPKDLERPDVRWNDDRASADQVAVTLASDPSLRAVAAWEDRRSGQGRIMGRLIGPDGRPFGGEFEASAGAHRSAPPAEVIPRAAMLPGGRFALQWVEQPEGKLCLRLFGSDGKPAGDIQRAPQSEPLAAVFSHWLIALPDSESYARLWVAKSGSLWFERRGPLGQPLGAPQLLFEASAGGVEPPTRPQLTRLADGRLLAVWEQKQKIPGANADAARGAPAPTRKVMGARLLGPDGQPRGAAFLLPGLGLGGGDIQPTAVADDQGGFTLAFCGNEGPVRDIYVRRFDRRAEPIGEPVLISTHPNEQDYPLLVSLGNRGTAVVFEDDLSGVDLIVGRRLDARGRPGPPVTLNQLETRFVPDRTLPAAVRLGDGLLVAFEDRRRSQGIDIFMAAFGPDWDQVK